jgi:excisionase family DNA binding protein
MSEKIALSVREACNCLSIGRTTFYELLRAGQLHVVKVGAKTLVPRDELVRFIATRTREAGAG